MKEKREVVMVMFRSNPQLGDYCCIRKAEIVKVNKKSMTVSDGITTRKFTFFGTEVTPTNSVYGSTCYRVYCDELVKEKFDGEKFDGYRISQGKEILTGKI